MCIKDLEVKLGRERWKYCYTAVCIIQLITVGVGIAFVSLAAFTQTQDASLTHAAKSKTWLSLTIHERVCLGLLSLTTFASILLVFICTFFVKHTFQYYANLSFHSVGAIILIVALGMKVHATVRMEHIESHTHSHDHEDPRHNQRYITKAIVSILVALNICLYVDIIIRLFRGREQRPSPVFDDVFDPDEEVRYHNAENEVAPLPQADNVMTERNKDLRTIAKNSDARPVYRPAVHNGP